MADPMTLDQFFATEAGQQLQMQMAGLSQMETANVMAALTKAADGGELEALNIDDVVLNSQYAEEAREEAQMYKEEQAKAADAGDWEKASEYAGKAEDALLEVEEFGGDVADSEIVDAQYDQMDLDNADWHQDIADDNADAAAAYAAEGDLDTAQIYADSAADAQTTANDFGAAGDAGGTYADQTIDTSSSFDATATASTYDAGGTYDATSTIDTTTTTE